MLDQMTPEEFAERWAHYLIEPWGDEWEMAGTVAAVVDNAINRYMAAKAGRQLQHSQLMRPDDYVPRPAWAQISKRKYLTDEESQRQMIGQ